MDGAVNWVNDKPHDKMYLLTDLLPIYFPVDRQWKNYRNWSVFGKVDQY